MHKVKIKKTGEVYPILAIAYDYEEVTVKREDDFVKEAKLRGEKFCGCCSSGFSDLVYGFKEVEFLEDCEKFK